MACLTLELSYVSRYETLNFSAQAQKKNSPRENFLYFRK